MLKTDEEKKRVLLEKFEIYLDLRKKILEADLELIEKHRVIIERMEKLPLKECVELSEIIIPKKYFPEDDK